jgi:hypothetical protein
MVSRIIFNNSGRLIVTERGANKLKKQEIPLEVINLKDSLYFKGKVGEEKISSINTSDFYNYLDE